MNQLDVSGSFMRGLQGPQQGNALAQTTGQPQAQRQYNALAAFGGPTQAAADSMEGGADPQAVDIAGSALGLNETTKKAALQEFLANGGQNLDPATTAWCAAFVDATLAQSGKQGTGKLNARSYLDWGQEVSEPQVGDVAVFSRGDPNGWQGHVGFFKGYNEDGTINVLGGNQSDSVSVQPYSADRLLGFRRG